MPRKTPQRPREFRIPYLDEAQYRTDRDLPWIKLRHDLIHGPNGRWFQRLPDSKKYQFIGLLLIGRQYGNRLPYDAEFLAPKMAATEPLDLDYFLAKGLIVDAETPITPISEQKTPITSIIAPTQGALRASSTSNQGALRASSTSNQGALRASSTSNQGASDSDRDSDSHSDSDARARTRAEAPSGASGESKCRVVSIHSLQLCQQYAQHLHDSGAGIDKPGGFARAIYNGDLAGQEDAAITAWLAARDKPQPKLHDDPDCPLCYGSGWEIVAGKGARPCPQREARAAG